MGQPADGLGLVAETRNRILQLRGIHRRFGDGLDCHLPVYRRIECLVDDTHPAASKDALDLVFADLLRVVSGHLFLFEFCGNRRHQRQHDGECRAFSNHGINADFTAVLFNDFIGNRQSETGALAHGLGGEKRVEDF